MLGTKLLGIVISALLPFTPVNYDWDIWQFPQTRQVTVRYSTSINVYDLGFGESVDLATLSSGLEANYQNSKHDYLVSFVHNINCSQACFYNMSNVSGYSIDSSNFVLNTNIKYYLTSSELYQKVSNFTQNGFVTESATFADENSVHTITLQIPRIDNNIFTVNINFPAVTQGIILDDIANHTLNASSYLLRLTLNNMTNNRNIPSDVMQQYQTYIDNGDYSSAYTYINNYIDDQTTIENTKTNNEVNNYNTQNTDLITNFNVENNFANQVESDFTDNIQQVPLADTKNNFQRTEFFQSANWVTQQFNRLTVNANMFGGLLKFSLVTGFILALIGRFKR